MDQQTVELMCLLQAGTHDAQTWARIEALLPTQRKLLAAAGKPTELADLGELLETWSGAAPPALSAAAVLQAAVIAEEELQQEDRAIALYQLSLERERTEFAPWHRLEALLQRRGEPERLEAILAAQAEAMLARPDIDGALTANAYQRLGQLRLERGRVDEAIAAYEQALELAADTETLSELAQAYCARGGDEDRRQAADLYSALGDVLGAEEGIAMLERALDLVPAHDDALDLLERVIPEDEQPGRLLERWKAYVAHSSNAQGVAARQQRIPAASRGTAAPAFASSASSASSAAFSGAAMPDSSASNGSAGHAAPPSGETNAYAQSAGDQPGQEPRDWNPKTLLGMGLPSLAAHDHGLGGSTGNVEPRVSPMPRRFQPPPMQAPEPAGHADLKVPPLFSGRAGNRADELTGETSSDWPEQLRLAAPALHSSPTSSFPPMLRHPSTETAGDNGAIAVGQSDATGPSALLLSSSPPSYAFGDVSEGEGQPRRGLGRWMLLLGGAAVLGISAGVAIAYGLRANSAPAARVSAPVPAVATAAPAAPDPTPPPPAEKGLTAEPTPGGSAVPDPSAIGGPTAVGADGTTGANVGSPSGVATPTPARAVSADAGEVKVAAKQLKVRGGLSAKEIAATLERGLTEIETCYDAALAQKATLRGTLKLSWSIDRAGKSNRLKKLGGTLKDATVERCSLDTIRDLQFPVSKKRPTNVVVPLAFQTRTGS